MRHQFKNLRIRRGRYVACWSDPETGKERERTIGHVGVDDELEMARLAADYVRRIKLGELATVPAHAAEPTIGQCVAAYFDDCRKRGVRSLHQMETVWAARGKDATLDGKLLGQYRPSQLGPLALRRWYASAEAASTPVVATKLRKILSAAVQLAAKTSEVVAGLPVLPTSKMPVHRSEPRQTIIPLERVGSVARRLWTGAALAEDSEPSWKAARPKAIPSLFYLVDLCTGLRCEELRQVRLRDIGEADISGEMVMVLRVPRTKNGTSFDVPLFGIARQAVELALQMHPDKSEPTAFLWQLSRKHRTPICPKLLTAFWRQLLADTLGTEARITTHDVRRTAATVLMSSGADPWTVDLLLNHGSRSLNRVQATYCIVQTVAVLPAFRRLSEAIEARMAAGGAQ